jgi:hypothetical protein
MPSRDTKRTDRTEQLFDGGNIEVLGFWSPVQGRFERWIAEPWERRG